MSSDTPTDSIMENGPKRWRFPKIPITVEPVLFGILFAIAFTEIVTTNTLETKVCMMKLNRTKENCKGPFNSTLEDLVQPTVAEINMVKTLIECIIPSILSFFIGPWSDSNGRKTFLLLPLLGSFLYNMMWAGLVFYMETLSIVMFLIPSFAIAFSGGLVSVFGGAYSYLGDVTNDTNRSMRITWVQCSLMLGIMLGNLLISKLFAAVSTYPDVFAFLIAASIVLLIFIYCVIFLPETVPPQANKSKFFTTTHIKEMWQTISTRRPNNGRSVVFLLMATICLILFIMTGESSIRYLSLREKFSITLQEYSKYLVISSIVSVIGSLGGVWIVHKTSCLSDIYLPVIILIFNIASSVCLTFPVSVPWFMTFFNLSCFTALLISLLRSEIMKTVARNELGKTFGFLACIESLAPLPAAPVYATVYSALLTTAPFDVYFVTALIWAICLICVIIIVVSRVIVGSPYYLVLSPPDNSEESPEDNQVSINAD